MMHSSDEEEYHSPDEKEDLWIHHKDIGVGGFGVVKLFVNQTTGDKVVLKECRSMNLSQEFMDRWYGELKIIKRLNHRNIVQAMEMPVGLHYQPMGNAPFICMEYCDRGDLRQVLRTPENCCGLTEREIRQICGDINAGIRFLHSEKVIHRDLKPENILIKNIGANQVVYKLTDFGYSKSYDQNSVCTSLVGTMQYVAPEVIKSRRYHSSVDFWSFGVVVFECITGRRPFLHGIASNNIAWIDHVANKQLEHIHIYCNQDSNDPIFSPDIPQPHRLSKTFESLITSWLRTSLHYTPERRGGRRSISDEAPCLSNMDHILSTKVMSLVCMSTGEEYFFNVEANTTYDELKRKLPGASSTSSPHHQLQILPSGHMPRGDGLVGHDIQDNMGQVFIFDITLEPSFKLMHTSSEVVSTITAYGDAKFSPQELKDVYARVFFHIRENYIFFKRLQDGHSAMLSQLNQHCTKVQSYQKELSNQLLITREIVTMASKTYAEDHHRLSSLLQQDKVPQMLSVDFLRPWEQSTSFLQQREQELEALKQELSKLQEEGNSYYRMTDDLQTNYDSSFSRLEEYQQNYVAAASDLYQDVKISRDHIPGRSMQDILLKATHEAQSIIEECLNGYNFGQTFSALRAHLQRMMDRGEALKTIKTDAMNLKDRLRSNLWDIIEESYNPASSSSLQKGFYSNPADIDSTIAMHIEGVDEATPLTNPQPSPQGIQRRQSAEEMRRQYSKASSGSVGSVDDPMLSWSIHNMQRLVSEEENTRVINKSLELRRQLSRSLSSTAEASSRILPISESGSQ